MVSATNAILQVKNLHVHFFAREGVVKAVNGVNLSLMPESTLALVGESGSGKTVTGLSLIRLIPYPGRVIKGEILFNGKDILQMNGEELRRLRGSQISMIFQDPISGLNPTVPIITQISEILTSHLPISNSEAKRRAIEILEQLGLPDPEKIANQYAFQLSGGMSQRVMIGIATALSPKVLVADEPTSALDVTIQAEIRRLKRDHHSSVILITHDLGIVAQMADEVAVMYAGSIVEYADTLSIFRETAHPYTWGLLGALPRVDAEDQTLRTIRGMPPDPTNLPEECPFLPRCHKALSKCRLDPAPKLTAISPTHYVACYNPVVHG